MVARLPDPADRRATLLEITQEGLSQLQKFRIPHDSAAAELFDVLTAAERQQLAGLLRRLQAAADADTAKSSAARPGLAQRQPHPWRKTVTARRAIPPDQVTQDRSGSPAGQCPLLLSVQERFWAAYLLFLLAGFAISKARGTASP